MNKCAVVYDYSRFFYELSCNNYDDILVHCYENSIPLETFAKALMETNPGHIIHVDFKNKKVIG